MSQSVTEFTETQAALRLPIRPRCGEGLVGDPVGGEESGRRGEDFGGDDGGVEVDGVGEDAGDEGAGGVADVAPEPVRYRAR